jgi:hypothetical protein
MTDCGWSQGRPQSFFWQRYSRPIADSLGDADFGVAGAIHLRRRAALMSGF